MYCPQCSTESSPGVQYCRVCGANLKVIGKAVALSEAVARSDRGPLPKLKEMMKGFNAEHVSEEVSRAMDHMNHEIMKVSTEVKPKTKSWSLRRKKTPAERRERHLTNGIVSMLWGSGVMVFLYYLTGALVLKLPPEIVQQIPFEIDPVVKVLWLIGLLPMMSGIGHILAGLLIRPAPDQPEQPVSFPTNNADGGPLSTGSIADKVSVSSTPASVTERTTNLLDRAS